MTARVVLVGKADCHLCDDAAVVVAGVCDELGVDWERISIHDHPDLADLYWDTIPVVLVDGERHDHLRVDPGRLRTALTSGHTKARPSSGQSTSTGPQ